MDEIRVTEDNILFYALHNMKQGLWSYWKDVYKDNLCLKTKK